MSATERPADLAFEEEADLVEWPLYTWVSIPDLASIIFSQFEIVDVATGLWGETVLSRSLLYSSDNLQSLVLTRYVSKHAMTSKLSSESYLWNVMVWGAFPCFVVFIGLLKKT